MDSAGQSDQEGRERYATAEERAATTERLIEDMRSPRLLSTSLAPPWWHHGYDFLRGRTPTQALADGDEHLVRDLIAHWYATSDTSAFRINSAPRVRIAAPRARQTA